MKAKVELYVAGRAVNSQTARRNLEAAQALVDGGIEVEIVDVLADPKRALAAGILLTPTLVRRQPKPVGMLLGTLVDHEVLLAFIRPTGAP
jgi:circadian clock protein KaiB